MTEMTDLPVNLLWLQSGGCGGCSLSLLGAEAQGMPGALEQALMNAPVREGEQDPVSVQHIVRSCDPCMVCTVH